MTWNYRVVKKDNYFAIHEAFYDEKSKKPHSITAEPCEPYGETLEELKEDIEWFTIALEKPVLNYKDFIK